MIVVVLNLEEMLTLKILMKETEVYTQINRRLICLFLKTNQARIRQVSFLLSLTFKVQKVIILCQIFEMDILINLHFMRSSESENHIYSVLSVCM